MVLGETDSPPPYVLIVDLFARDGSRPASLEAALARKNDLIFSNQTILRLEAFERGRKAAGAAHAGPPVLYLSYRALPEEAGPEKAFDLSRPTAEDRWQVGCLDMREALRRLKTQTMGGAVHVIRRPMDRKRLLGSRPIHMNETIAARVAARRCTARVGTLRDPPIETQGPGLRTERSDPCPGRAIAP